MRMELNVNEVHANETIRKIWNRKEATTKKKPSKNKAECKWFMIYVFAWLPPSVAAAHRLRYEAII